MKGFGGSTGPASFLVQALSPFSSHSPSSVSSALEVWVRSLYHGLLAVFPPEDQPTTHGVTPSLSGSFLALGP